MKRIIGIILIALMFFPIGTAFARISDESEADATIAINAIKEIRYNVEAGVNFNDYSAVVRKAGIECRRYADKYPKSSPEVYSSYMLNMMLDPYKDAEKVWHDAIFNKEELVKPYSVAFRDFPIIKKKISPRTSDGAYWYKEVLQALWEIAAKQEQILDVKRTRELERAKNNENQ